VDHQITYGQVHIVDSALPQQMFDQLLSDAHRRIGWSYGWNTPANPSSRYWHHEIGRGNKLNAEDITHNVLRHPLPAFGFYLSWLRKNLVPQSTKVVRCYLNAHTYGTDGWPHTDTDRDDELTAVLYLVPDWQPGWAGETVVFDRNEVDIEAAVLPKANRLLVFPSDRLHAPRPLSKTYGGLRVVLVVKLAPPEGGSAFFSQRDAEQQSKE
jgi:hypothetical protein